MVEPFIIAVILMSISFMLVVTLGLDLARTDRQLRRTRGDNSKLKVELNILRHELEYYKTKFKSEDVQ